MHHPGQDSRLDQEDVHLKFGSPLKVSTFYTFCVDSWICIIFVLKMNLKEKLSPKNCHIYYVPNYTISMYFLDNLIQILLSTQNVWNVDTFHGLSNSRCTAAIPSLRPYSST
jgi:hypothetical protein